MIDVTMKENGQPWTAEDFTKSLQWHAKHEPDANISINPIQRDELFELLRARITPHGEPDTIPECYQRGSYIAGWKAAFAAMSRCFIPRAHRAKAENDE